MNPVTRRGRVTPAVIFFIGLAVGGGAVEGYHVAHEKTTAEVFARRLRCDALANQYAKRESSDTDVIHVELVGYSTLSNSCVAYLTTVSRSFPPDTTEGWRVIDVLSGEVFYMDQCLEEQGRAPYCGEGNNMKFERRSQAAFQQVMEGRRVDVEKIK